MPPRVKVLVVGQTPPPYHGQAIMIERLVRGRFARAQLFHVRMAFSDSIGEVGRFRISKIFHLVGVIARIIYCRLVHRPTILCYPPAGPNRTPLYRDLAILFCTRWLFPRTILYFHAGGVSELYPQLSRPLQWLFRRALFHADAAIRISLGSPPDPQVLEARRQYVVPNGIEDEFERFATQRAPAQFAQQETHLAAHAPSNLINTQNSITHSESDTLVLEKTFEAPPLRMLFIGMLTESKGLLVLIDACKSLVSCSIPFELNIAGQFASPDFEEEVRLQISQANLDFHVHFLGSLSGDAKWQAFAAADVLCLPTFYEAETFGLVLVEAMSFRLPVVATRWRGIPEVVDDGVTGFLVPPKDSGRFGRSSRTTPHRSKPSHRSRRSRPRKIPSRIHRRPLLATNENIFVQTAESTHT